MHISTHKGMLIVFIIMTVTNIASICFQYIHVFILYNFVEDYLDPVPHNQNQTETDQKCTRPVLWRVKNVEGIHNFVTFDVFSN